jgi:acyl-CoA synthetase (AMP-forming)/AMP-acid ligase II
MKPFCQISSVRDQTTPNSPHHSHSALQLMLEKGAMIQSSGTTGDPKTILRNPENIKECNKVAVNAQLITSRSSIYTVTKISHAGGLLAQTLPALSIQASIEIDSFNPFSFFRKFSKHTHTFLPPEHMNALIKTKTFQNVDFGKRWILTGSSPVDLNVVKLFVSRNAIVQPNWGMSEVGPLVINHVFRTVEDVEDAQSKCTNGVHYLGDKMYCDWKIVNNELVVRSPMCIYEGWFHTGDIVQRSENNLYFVKRKN